MGALPDTPSHRPLSGPNAITRPLPQPQLREEDECPICHQALPSRGPDGSENAREAHVQSCIESHFSSSGPRVSHPPPSAAPGIVPAAAEITTQSHSSNIRPVPIAIRPTVGSNELASSSLQQRRRVAGMLVYQASEKDCVGENGEDGQECVICFEEFAVGDEMGRLECLCKFHKVNVPSLPRCFTKTLAISSISSDPVTQACIRQWWDTKGTGACPVHQEGT